MKWFCIWYTHSFLKSDDWCPFLFQKSTVFFLNFPRLWKRANVLAILVQFPWVLHYLQQSCVIIAITVHDQPACCCSACVPAITASQPIILLPRLSDYTIRLLSAIMLVTQPDCWNSYVCCYSHLSDLGMFIKKSSSPFFYVAQHACGYVYIKAVSNFS